MTKIFIILISAYLAISCSATDEEAGLSEDHVIFSEDGGVATGSLEAAQTTWPRNMGGCGDVCNPADKCGYHRSTHTGACTLPDKLPVVIQIIDGGSGQTGNLCQQAITLAINSVFNQTNQLVYFVYGNGSSPHPSDITFDCNDTTSPLAVTVTTQNAVSIDPWNGPRRLGLRSDVKVNSQALWDRYQLHRDRVGPVAGCINMTRLDYFHATLLHELMHALGFAHDNYDAGPNLLTIMSNGLPTYFSNHPECTGGTEPGKQVQWADHWDRRYIDPVFRNMLAAYYANNALLSE